MIHFLYPLYFLLLIPVISFLIFLYFKGGKKNIFGPMEDLKNVFKYNTWYYKIYFIIIFIIFLLFILIFSKPVITNINEKNIKNGIDIQIVMDVSFSMIAEDLKPNRLQVAKDVISDFLNEISSDRVGIIIFAGKTFTSLPLNFDYNIVKKIFEKINIDTINQEYGNMQGTAVGDALILAADSFSKYEISDERNREKVIILLTDGEANKGIDPLVALEYIKKNNPDIKIYTIGIGGDKETNVVIKNNFGQSQSLPIGGVDEQSLKIIASGTNGKYFRAKDRKTFKDIFSEISKLEKKEFVSETIKINKEKYTYFLYLTIFFFITFLFMKYKKRIF